MKLAVNAASLADAASAEEQLARAAAAGYVGFEPVLTDRGPLTHDATPDDLATLARRAADAGIELVGLSSASYMQRNYGSEEAADRQHARDLTLHMLDLAAAAGIGAILVIPAVVGRPTEPSPRVTYLDAFNRTVDTLSALRHEAEARAVTIAIENAWTRFLLSPIEVVELIDQINSPCVAAYFDVGNVLPFGYPEDWIRTLGRRIARVHAKDYDLTRPGAAGFCLPGEGSVDWPAVMAALADVGYAGPLTYEGPNDVTVARGRLARIVAGESPK
jgi:hexulose-6-phosphate isomerase